MEKTTTDARDKPKQAVMIANCGEILQEPENYDSSHPKSSSAAEVTNLSPAEVQQQGIGEIQRDNEVDGEFDLSTERKVGDEEGNKEDKDGEEEEEILTEEKMASMSEKEKRLFKIRMRINQGRKANRVEVEEEYKRNNDPNYGKYIVS